MPISPRRTLLAALSLALAAAGCSSGRKAPPPGPAEVGIVTLAATPVTISNTLTGRTAATTSSDVRPQVDGVIQARLFAEGSLVRAGQPLYQIDPRLYRATLDQDRALLESAQATLFTDQAKADRYRTLSDSQAVSKQTIDDAVAAARAAQASVHQYQAAVESARVNLEYTRVLAPISGRISRSAVTPGALVTAGQTSALATIQQLDPIYVDITQSSSDLLKLRRSLAKGSVLPTSAAVRLTLEDGTDYPGTGTIEFAEVTVDEQAGTVTLRARFPNPDGILLPGMFVRVDAPQGVVPNGILAPQQGITRDAKGDATALVLDAANKVVQRTVTAAQAIGATWLVTQGLNAGDRLIVEGTEKAAIGAVVKPVAVKLGR
ncbi:MAG TPA: efflux RND transporter periplasmic adaptor subunit [Sphingomonas sp.]